MRTHVYIQQGTWTLFRCQHMASALGMGLVIIPSFPHSYTNLVQHLCAKPCSRCRHQAAVGSLVSGQGASNWGPPA